jgi:MarR family transcriptional regulator, 2-MHQ and catechol-resistance regulon repressor
MPTHYHGDEVEKRALEVYIKLFRASASVEAACQKGINSAGLTVTQFGALESLYHLGSMTISQIAEKHLMSRNNLTVVVRNLEKSGFVRIEVCPSDRRALMVHLAPEGEAIMLQALRPHVQEVVATMSALSAKEQITLAQLLKKLGTSLSEDSRGS